MHQLNPFLSQQESGFAEVILSMLTRIFNPPFLTEFSAIDPGTVAHGEEDGSLTPHQLRAEMPRPPSGGGGPPHRVPLRHFTALGPGEVGDKVRQLDEAHAAVTEVGLNIPPGNVIIEDRLIPILRRLGLGNSLAEADQHPDASAKIKANGINSDDALWLIKAMEGIPRDRPMVVRSSAMGDAEGSGTYESLFVPGNFPALGRAVFQVLASYFTEEARTFRALSKTQHGLGILVMPAIVQELPTIIPDRDCMYRFREGPSILAPILSGSGVTSNCDGESEIWAVPGLGGGVSQGYPESLTSSHLARYGRDFLYHLLVERTRLHAAPGLKRISSLLRTDAPVIYETGPKRDYSAMGLTSSQREGILTATSHRILLEDDLLGQISLMDFLNALQSLEQRLGYRAYVEWALRFEDAQPRFYIVQVARADLKGGFIDFDGIQNPLFAGHSVYGFQRNHLCPAMVYCPFLSCTNSLRVFDATHPEGYVLLYPANLKYNNEGTRTDPLTIATIPHATAIIEIQDRVHSRLPISHWAGQIEKTGKVFAVMADTSFLPRELRDRMSHPHPLNELLVLEEPVVLNASARQNRLVVSEGVG